VGQVSRMQALFATGGARASLVTSQGCQPPVAVACGTPASLASASITTTGATVSWGAVSGATSYTLQYKTSAATAYTTVSGITATSSALSGLTAGTAYNWQVSATCAAGTSAYATGTFTTTAVVGACTDIYEANNTRTTGKPIAVNTSISAVIGTSTDVDWYSFSNTTAAKNIQIDLSTLPLDYDVKLYKGATLVATSQLGGTAAEQIKYNNGTVTTYYVNVYGYGGAFNANSCYTLRASTSATAFRTNGTSSDVEQNINLEKIQGDVNVTVYPNPSNGAITVDVLNLTTATTADVKIIDITGRVVYYTVMPVSKGVNSQAINLQTAKGIYQVVVRTGDNVTVQKLVIE
jgi:Secretion system C-terminal sorting domain